MVAEALERLGRIDIPINNAGFRASSPITEMSTEEWRAAAAANFDGPFFCTRAVVPGRISNGYGRIITVSGLNAFHGRPNWSHICGSKMGAIGMTRALAIELGRYNILVNHVVPGAYNAHPNLDRIPPRASGTRAGAREHLRVPVVRRCELHHGSDVPRQRRGVSVLGSSEALRGALPRKKPRQSERQPEIQGLVRDAHRRRRV